MSRRKEIFGQVGVYTFGAQLAQLVTLVAAVLSRRFLGPTQVGIWATLQIVTEYAKYSNLGAIYSVAREVPYYIGKGETRTADEIKNTVFTLTTIGSGLVALGILLFVFITWGRWSSEMTGGLIILAFIIFLQRTSDFMVSLLRCYKKFSLASSQMIWSAVVNALLVGILAHSFKIYGFMWALTLSLLFNIVYICFHRPFNFYFRINADRVRAVIGFGMPLLLIGVLTTAMRSIDRILVAYFMGFRDLGFYSIALMVNAYIGNFSNSFAIVLVPHLQEKYGAKDNPKDLTQFLYKASYVSVLTQPALIGFAWTVVPYFVTLFMPQFTAGIEAMKILSLGIFFVALVQPYSDFLITVKKHYALFPLIGLASIAALGLNYWVIRLGWGIAGVAAVMTLVFWFNYTTTYFYASSFLDSRRKALKMYFVYLGYGAYLVIALLLVNGWIRPDAHSLSKTIWQFLLFAVFYMPFVWILNRKYGILGHLKEKLRARCSEKECGELPI